ncbi:MAG TPA: hypothetical protein VM686_30500 [Polyangiaceae bacterium]|nr:hypothetical protein [Polyangiaceae bacterium]
MIELRVVPRVEPLVACAAIGVGDAARGLGERLLRLSDSERARLRGAAGTDFVLVCGAEADLPWCDGIGYLGRDPAAPGLLLPTTLTVDVPAALFERALARRLENVPQPWVVWFSPWLVVPAGVARSLARKPLEAWLAGSAP